VWGLGKVISLEHPELWGGLLDIAPNADAEAAETLVAEVMGTEGEDQVAFRAGRRYVARLVRCQQNESQPVQIAADGTYLITGGCGGLGLRTAQWLVAKGARCLVLIGRSGAASSAAREAVAQLEQAGGRVIVARADVSNAADMQAVFKGIQASLPPVRGIIHAAGILDDGVLLRQDSERLRRVLAPKVTGTWILHQLTRDMPLDFFVCFSSAAALLGTAGQGNYAAANAFLDTFVSYRQAQDLPGLSISWGPWAQAGMVAEMGSREQQRLLNQGWGVIAPEQGLRALDVLLGQREAHVGVLPVDWSRFVERYSGVGLPPVLTELVRFVAPQVLGEQASTQHQTLRQRLQETPVAEHQALLLTSLQTWVATILGLIPAEQPEPHQSLHDLGFDSLMHTELRNKVMTELATNITLAEFINSSSIAQLARILRVHIALERLIPSGEVSSQTTDDMEDISL
jgi:NADP-dependent 3-hydroxy acid dehydrogenase YdfG/acyl carrier protein